MLIARARAAFLPASEVREEARRCNGVMRLAGARRGLVVLVADVADELLEQVLQRDEANGVLQPVLHEREVLAAREAFGTAARCTAWRPARWRRDAARRGARRSS